MFFLSLLFLNNQLKIYIPKRLLQGGKTLVPLICNWATAYDLMEDK